MKIREGKGMNVTLGFGLVLVIIAALLLGFACLLMLIDATHLRTYYELVAAGGAFGVVGLKIA